MKIIRPTLLLDEAICRRNIKRMALKAKNNGIIFRPHFKTHRSAYIGDWFREFGVKAITVSSVSMADYFATHGWEDITIALPVNILEIEEINHLASHINLNLLVESSSVIAFLGKKIRHKVGMYIEIDEGYHRTGVSWDDTAQITSIIRRISQYPNLIMKGLLTHSGHTYQAGGEQAIRQIHQESISRLNWIKQKLMMAGTDVFILSIGDTPSCSIIERFDGVDEIRPGNFIFYDVMQSQLGSCAVADIAVAMACPVIATYPERGEMVVYGGAVHLSKDFIIDHKGRKVFGRAVSISHSGWNSLGEDCYMALITQEHGVIKGPAEIIQRYHHGDLIGILPVHSCLTVSCMRSLMLLDGATLTIF